MATDTCAHERCVQYFKERGGDNGECLEFIRECRNRRLNATRTAKPLANGVRDPWTGV